MVRCDGSHRHANLECPKGASGDKARDAARLPPRLCHLIAEGCEDLLRREKKKKIASGGGLPPAMLPYQCMYDDVHYMNVIYTFCNNMSIICQF